MSGFCHVLPATKKASMAKLFFRSLGLSACPGLTDQTASCSWLVTHRLFPRLVLFDSDVADVMS